jgi:SAM-dependent methyltransferase
VREALLELLRCPRCRTPRSFALSRAERDAREVRAGTLTCRACAHSAAVERGVVDLLFDPPEHVRREAAGLERFAEEMRNDGWDRDRIRALPCVEHGYWWSQRLSLERLEKRVAFRPGERLLDLGANNCWAANRFARAGLDVIALDIATAELQGLFTADWFLDDGETYFERVLGTMFDLPLADGVVDHVFACQVLHHNTAEELRHTLAELYRVLRPGGQLHVVNEQLEAPLHRRPDPGAEVAHYEGNEHVYFFHEYFLAARRAGFRVHVVEPADAALFNAKWELDPAAPWGPTLRAMALHLARKSRLGRRAALHWLNLVAGGVSLNLRCVKPDRSPRVPREHRRDAGTTLRR